MKSDLQFSITVSGPLWTANIEFKDRLTQNKILFIAVKFDEAVVRIINYFR